MFHVKCFIFITNCLIFWEKLSRNANTPTSSHPANYNWSFLFYCLKSEGNWSRSWAGWQQYWGLDMTLYLSSIVNTTVGQIYGPYCSLKLHLGSGPWLHGDWRDQRAEKLKEDKGRFYQHFCQNNFLGPTFFSLSRAGRGQASQLMFNMW